VRTARIDAWLLRDFPDPSHAQAVALVDRIGTELAAWNIVTETDRVEAAAIVYAGADLERLDEAVTLALHDWRDLLVSVGDA
jgi:hypothetical protein